MLNGDRHWKYHSVHPETGTHEISVGAATDAHARHTSPGEDPLIHKFHKEAGGFLQVEVARARGESQIHFRLRNVLGAIDYEFSSARKLKLG